MTVNKALTIAGSDSGGGAGIQADLKTFQELQVYGMSALTAVTAQNTLGVNQVYPLSPEAVSEQMEAVGTDLGVDALKTGMLFSREIIETTAATIRRMEWDRYVLDPVMVAKGGAPLLQEDAVEAVIEHLVPLALVVTPNIPEAQVMTGHSIRTLDDRREAAKKLAEKGAQHIVIKGGHDSDRQVMDLWYDGEHFDYLESQRIDTPHTHGTGCTFAAALTAELAKDKPVGEALKQAKVFIQAAIEDQLGIGNGHGPTNHWAYNRRTRAKNV